MHQFASVCITVMLSDTCQVGFQLFWNFWKHSSTDIDKFLLIGQLTQLVRMLPIVIRLFPELVKTTFYRGSVVVLNKVTPATDTDLERELARKIEQKASDQAKDNQMVIKVAEAIKCCESTFNATTLVKEFVLVAIKSLIEGKTTQACGQKMFDQMATCIRENALRQDTPRKFVYKGSYHRPAKGHGSGRAGF
jgi:hypothetical protein